MLSNLTSSSPQAIKKNRPEGKLEIVQTLLDRGMDVAQREYTGSTARDYIDIYDVTDADVLRQTIDAHVLDLVATDQHYRIGECACAEWLGDVLLGTSYIYCFQISEITIKVAPDKVV